MCEDRSATYRWVKIAPGIEIKVKFDQDMIDVFTADGASGDTEIAGEIVRVVMTLDALNGRAVEEGC